MITLKEVPQNLLDGYLSSFDNDFSITSDVGPVDLKLELLPNPDINSYCHYRIVGFDSNYFYKLFNFNKSSLPDFMPSVKYDIGFSLAVSKNFYSTISPVKDYIYDEINNVYVGYVLPRMQHLTLLDSFKFLDLLERLKLKIKSCSLAHTDIHINNIMEWKGEYYLIDLETVTPLNVFRDKEVRDKYFVENLKPYQDMVLSI